MADPGLLQLTDEKEHRGPAGLPASTSVTGRTNQKEGRHAAQTKTCIEKGMFRKSAHVQYTAIVSIKDLRLHSYAHHAAGLLQIKQLLVY